MKKFDSVIQECIECNSRYIVTKEKLKDGTRCSECGGYLNIYPVYEGENINSLFTVTVSVKDTDTFKVINKKFLEIINDKRIDEQIRAEYLVGLQNDFEKIGIEMEIS